MNTDNKVKAVIYSRVGNEDPEQKWSDSLFGQEIMAEKCAELENFEVVDRVRIIGSSHSLNHTSKLLKTLDFMEENGVGVLICKNLSRIMRGFNDRETVERIMDEKNMKIYLTDDSPYIICEDCLRKAVKNYAPRA